MTVRTAWRTKDGWADVMTVRSDENTRLAPHMERYVEITPVGPAHHRAWVVRLKVGVQSFNVNFECETREEAAWMRDMLCIALDALVKEQEQERDN